MEYNKGPNPQQYPQIFLINFMCPRQAWEHQSQLVVFMDSTKRMENKLVKIIFTTNLMTLISLVLSRLIVRHSRIQTKTEF